MTDEPTAAAHNAEVLGRVPAVLRRADLALLAAKEPPLRKLGVSGSLYSVLMNLQVEPGLTGAELARVVGVTPQAIAPLVGKLVERGWIERRAHARHTNVQELHLTDSGRREAAEADQVMVHLDAHLRRSLGNEDYERLAALLGRVIETLPAWTPPDGAATEETAAEDTAAGGERP
ncbi:MarR family winged helix-turn-helix transcriptional regulator [Streptomonospora sediminis]